MKAYIEFIGNEDRRPKTGERFEDDNGSIVVACYDHEEIRRIVTSHEIEIPDGAYEFHGHFHKIGDCLSRGGNICFPIPCKKKVKKWFWLVEDKSYCNAGYYNANGVLRTEEEIKQTFPNAKWYHRIDETMIEVPE